MLFWTVPKITHTSSKCMCCYVTLTERSAGLKSALGLGLGLGRMIGLS